MIKFTPERRPPDEMPKLLTEEEAAAILKITPTQLRRLRYERRGPATIKVGGSRRIPHEAFINWLSELGL